MDAAAPSASMDLHIALAVLAILAVGVTPAAGQVVLDAQPTELTIEAYANATGAAPAASRGASQRPAPKGFADGAVRLYGRVRGDDDLSIGVRVSFEADTDAATRFGERSLVLTSRYGRLELGYRGGLPDVLVGYAPNPFQFVSAEFGPSSGASLDPNGGLQTRFLSRPLGRQIDDLSILGVSPSTFGDQSPKLIYVSPKLDGYLLGVSYAPRIEQRASGHDNELVQLGVVKEIYAGEDVYRFGGSYGFARGRNDTIASVDDLHSVSAGGEVVLDASLALGVSATWNGGSGLRAAPTGSTFRGETFGFAGSVNWTEGPWQVGAYAQSARSPGDTARDGDDRLIATQIGGAYRFTPTLRVFAAWWHYDFRDEGGRIRADRHDGEVFLLGFRAQL
jgi:hypothetical protein